MSNTEHSENEDFQSANYAKRKDSEFLNEENIRLRKQRKNIGLLLLVLLVLIVVISQWVNSVNNREIEEEKFGLREKVWFTYMYYQRKAAREARSASDTDEAFNNIWPGYSNIVVAKYNLVGTQYDSCLTSMINAMANAKNWEPQSYTEDQYYYLMQKADKQ